MLVQTGAFLDLTALEDSAGPMGSGSMSSASTFGFPSGVVSASRAATAHDPAELAVHFVGEYGRENERKSKEDYCRMEIVLLRSLVIILVNRDGKGPPSFLPLSTSSPAFVLPARLSYWRSDQLQLNNQILFLTTGAQRPTCAAEQRDERG